MRYYIRFGMLSLQYKPLWAIHHVSPILCQISEHLKDAQLTKLLNQFLKYKSQFFSKLKTRKFDMRLYCSLFPTAFVKLGIE